MFKKSIIFFLIRLIQFLFSFIYSVNFSNIDNAYHEDKKLLIL